MMTEDELTNFRAELQAAKDEFIASRGEIEAALKEELVDWARRYNELNYHHEELARKSRNEVDLAYVIGALEGYVVHLSEHDSLFVDEVIERLRSLKERL